MPVTLDSTVTSTDGVAFVTVRVRNTEPVDRGIRIANRLDGAVLPPRRHGTPEPGWSIDGYAGVVAADSTLALGYACAVDLDKQRDDGADPVALVEVDDPASIDADPMDDVLGDLADHRPPPDTVSAPAVVPEAAAESLNVPSGKTIRSNGRNEPTGVPPAVARYLRDVDERVSRAESLADGSVGDATQLLEAGTDPDGLTEIVALEATALKRLAARADSLASRAAAVDVPTDALERLA